MVQVRCTKMSPALVILLIVVVSALADHWADREALIDREESMVIGASLVLSAQEEQVNSILMGFKHEEVDAGFKDPSKFNPSRHFFHAVGDIERSEVFKILRVLPKGGSLHGHDTALVSGEYLYNLTYSANLYGCVQNERLYLHFFQAPDASCDWELLEDLRAKNGTFDDFLKTQLSLITDDPDREYPDINAAWAKFIQTFITVDGLLLYVPIWKETFYQILKELYEDNVMYIEFRTTLPSCYELNGTTYGANEVAGFLKEVADQFKLDYPDFQGARIIYAPVRSVNNTTVEEYVRTALQLQKIFPEFFAGFDLVGQEDLGRPLSEFMDQLQELKNAGMKLIFHAGETNWYGTTTDFNVVDAILLNTTRIGHGYALLKHPEVLKLVKERGVAIEVSPISNQVLKLVSDIRNHPANYFIANGYPVVICNDDPSFWGARAMSYDWYQAFMGMTSRSTDLRFLKQLALNTYLYSVMPIQEREAAIQGWTLRWNAFINNILTKYNSTNIVNKET